MSNGDQDIDTAGTEADDEFRERHGGDPIAEPDVTKGPLGNAPEETNTPRGGEPATLHRGEDDEVAFERSPEYHDRPGSGRDRGGPYTAPDSAAAAST